MPTRELRTVADVMTRKVVTVTEQDVLADIDEAMRRLRVRHLPVVSSDGRLVGLLSHPDLLHAASSSLADRDAESADITQVPVGKIMQQEVVTVQPDDPLVEAGKLMWDAKLGCLP